MSQQVVTVSPLPLPLPRVTFILVSYIFTQGAARGSPILGVQLIIYL
jgi:hypothetical protein